MGHRALICVWLLTTMGSSGCSEPEEPARVTLEVVEDRSGIVSVETTLGYTVELSQARMAVADLMFTVAGEAHAASLWRRFTDVLIPTAHAHPGHSQGGDITGELRGRFIVDWLDGEDVPIGLATLLCGSYTSANFTLIRAEAADGLAPTDALVGHTAVLRGSATRDGRTTRFVAIIDSPEGRQLVGAPFEFEVAETSDAQLGLRLLTADPHSGAALFDDLDFATLDTDGDGEVHLDEASTEPALVDAYNMLRRALQTHDFFDVHPTGAIR